MCFKQMKLYEKDKSKNKKWDWEITRRDKWKKTKYRYYISRSAREFFHLCGFPSVLTTCLSSIHGNGGWRNFLYVNLLETAPPRNWRETFLHISLTSLLIIIFGEFDTFPTSHFPFHSKQFSNQHCTTVWGMQWAKMGRCSMLFYAHSL